MWNKLGVNWVGYKRGDNADIFNSAQRFDDSQRQLLQRYMQKVYETFKGHVEKGRGNKLTKSLDQMAGGRIYTGKQALDLGLVDHIGGLKEAIDYAASKTSLKDYEVRIIPRPKDFFTMIMEQYSGQGQKPSDIAAHSGGAFRTYDLHFFNKLISDNYSHRCLYSLPGLRNIIHLDLAILYPMSVWLHLNR